MDNQEQIKFPLEEAIKIQEALKPLGYTVHSYKDTWSTGSWLVSVDLRPGGAFSYRKNPDVPVKVGDI